MGNVAPPPRKNPTWACPVAGATARRRREITAKQPNRFIRYLLTMRVRHDREHVMRFAAVPT
jgi:hypothetical protein